MEHANIFSASQLERLFACPGSSVLTRGIPRKSSQYSAWGTGTHELSALALEHGDHIYAERHGTTIKADGFEFTVDDEMVEVAKVYTDYVRDVAGADGTILVEQRVQFDKHLGVPAEHEAFGTADAIIVKGSEMIVVDLKTGRGVEVEVEGNPQLHAYALGALEIAETVADIERVRMVIVQPRAGGIKEHDLSVDELRAWARDHAAPACGRVLEAFAYRLTSDQRPFVDAFLVPGEKQCKFCAAKATCPALRDEVLTAAVGSAPASVDEFDAVMDTRQVHAESLQDTPEQWLAACLSKVDLIEDWCKAVREEAHRRLRDGQSVPGYKLVAGKRGARAWTDASKVEEMLRKQFRLTLEQAYDLKLISPTSAEKLVKAGALGPRQWSTLQELVHQPEGKPHVAPESDSRPSLTLSASEFPLV